MIKRKQLIVILINIKSLKMLARLTHVRYIVTTGFINSIFFNSSTFAV